LPGVHDALTATGDTELVHAGLQRLRRRGNGAHWQRTTSGPMLDPGRVVRAAVAVTVAPDDDARIVGTDVRSDACCSSDPPGNGTDASSDGRSDRV
jgi:hypothetical protein